MRIVHLDARRLQGLSSADSADRWLTTLAASGVVRTAGAEAGSPRAEMTGLYEDLWEIAALEEVIAAGRVTDRIHLAPPARWWLWMPAGYAVCFLIALSRSHFEDRLLTFGILLNVLGAVAVGLVAWVAAATWSWRRQKRREAAAAAASRERRMGGLLRRQAALLQRPFAIRAGERVVVNCPDLRWAEDALRRLPPTDATPRRQALVRIRQQLQSAIHVLAADPDPDPAVLVADRAVVPG